MNWPAVAVPPGVVTVTSTMPLPGGLVTVTCVLESAVIVPAAPPKLTLVAPARLVPVIVTAVPPAVVPLDGDTPVTAGFVECDDEPDEPEPDEPEPDEPEPDEDEPDEPEPEDDEPEDDEPEDEVPDVDGPEEDEPGEFAR